VFLEEENFYFVSITYFKWNKKW